MLSDSISTPTLKVAFLNVGQGDTIVISCDDTREAIVVDCNDENAVLDYLSNENIKHFRGLIITHLHADHYNGAVGLLSNCSEVPGMSECEVVLYNSLSTTSTRVARQLLADPDGHCYSLHGRESLEEQKGVLAKLLDWCKRTHRAKPALSNLPNLFQGYLGSRIEFLYPSHSDMDPIPTSYRGNINNLSVIIRVRGSGSSALLAGDIEPFGWKQFLSRTAIDLTSSVLKFPHHGAWKLSKNQPADVDELINLVNPSIIIISVGTDDGINKKYLHPNRHVFEAIQKKENISLLCTQATSQCSNTLSAVKDAAKKTLDDHSIAHSLNLLTPQTGCSCAGHIVVELGDWAEVLHPIPLFHQSSIVDEFYQRAKCRKTSPVGIPLHSDVIAKG